MTEAFRFQVNLAGMIDLLSNHLYSRPEVFLRELLQNAVDAIEARKGLACDHQGEVRFEVHTGSSPTLVISDNGVGLTEEEVHRFLATIGESSKRDAPAAQDFIGRFGIGLLSAFVVSDRITLITQSAKSHAQPVEWIGHADGTYTVRRLEQQLQPGTQVYLRPKPGSENWFEFDNIREALSRYGALLPVPIEVQSGSRIDAINRIPPWQQEAGTPDERREQALQFGRQELGGEFLDAIPLSALEGQIQGVAYLLPFPVTPSSRQDHRVYLRGMLISEKDCGLLPRWAFFVRCLINARNLRPTADREGLYEDETLEQAREELGQSLRSHLARVARTNPDRFREILAIHTLALQELALEDDECYRLFIDWFPWETSQGTMTIPEIYRRYPTLEYVTTPDQFRQIASVAGAQGRCVVNGGYVHQKDLLARLPEFFDDREVERIQSQDLADAFHELSEAEEQRFSQLIDIASQALEPFGCAVDLRHFQPVELPTLYTTNTTGEFLRSLEQSKQKSDKLWSDLLDNLSDEARVTAARQLWLNASNPLVQKLAQTTNKAVVKKSVEMLYLQALLLGHYPLQPKELSLLTTGLSGMLELALGN